MIVVREVFSLKFGKAKEAKALMKESKQLMDEPMQKRTRLLFDLVGPAYTMVLEATYENLAEFEKIMSGGLSQAGWQEWYQKFIPIIEKSYREIFTIQD
jgi:hypothetical protein